MRSVSKISIAARVLMLVFSLCMTVYVTNTFVSYLNVSASTIEDDVSGGGGDQQQQDNNADVFEDYLVKPAVNGEQMEFASNLLAPVTNIIGYIIGVLMILIFVLSTLITALDLLFLAFPPIRGLLYKGGQAGTTGYGGYGGRGGYGAGGYGGYGGGYGANSYSTPGQEDLGIGGRITQFISDEAAMCAAIAGDAPNAQMQSGQPVKRKSVIATYFKKRIFSIILLVVSAVILTSSALLGTGVNLARWGIELINMLNEYIPV